MTQHEDAFSDISKKNRLNNTLIEKAAIEIAEKRREKAKLIQSESKLEKM